MKKNCKFLLSITLWPLIWPLQPSSAFFNFFEILVTYEVQWYTKMFYLSVITSRKFRNEIWHFGPLCLVAFEQSKNKHIAMSSANAQIVKSDSRPVIDYLSLALGKWFTNNICCFAWRSNCRFFQAAKIQPNLIYE